MTTIELAGESGAVTDTGTAPEATTGASPAALTVCVVGGGASGILAAAHLLRAARETATAVRVEVFEPAAELGRGVAYGTTDPEHLLNVPATGMSAWPDRPTHFADWAQRRGLTLADGFAGRPDFARYLQSVLDNARAAAPAGSLTVHRTAAVDLGDEVDGGGRTVLGADGTRCRADLVVLATGWSGAERGTLPDHPRVIGAPATPGALDAVPARGQIVVLGAGLTGIDTALSLLRAEPEREVLLVSRSGELPRTHLREPSRAWTLGPGGLDRLPARGPLTLIAIRDAISAETVAARAAGVPWQSVMDALKPVVAGLWVRLPESCRKEFLRTDLRRWDVHRHRMAPVIADRVSRQRELGRLRVLAARATVTVSGDGLRVALAVPTGSATELAATDLSPAAVVDCRGWGAAGVEDPHGFGQALIRRGLARADPLGLSLDTTVDGRLRDRRGRVVPDLVAIGPARRAATWESTALGAIREQAAELARSRIGIPVPGVREHRLPV